MILLGFLARAVLTVGDGQTFGRIEDAVGAAGAGDTIEVFAKQRGYAKTAIRVTTPGLHFIGVTAGPRPILLDGTGYDYSGAGNVPRAIFQIDPGADGVTIENFELVGAHNASYNGAAVRVNQASRATIRNCDIHGNDMGIMSNGIQGNPAAASDQLVDHCRIYENGNLADPGYNHNLYLGGTSATVQFCDIHSSLTGHNLKSRAHYNLVQYCYIHASANRELDFVEDWDTTRADSNAVLIGNVIVKSADSSGNRNTIHFGEESGLRIGTLFLINDTILTPFVSPVVLLSTPQGGVRLINSVIYNGQQSAATLVGLANGALLTAVDGWNNWIATPYDITGTRIDAGTRYSSDFLGANPQFLATYALPHQTGFPPGVAKYVDGLGSTREGRAAYRFTGNGNWTPWGTTPPTAEPFIGAG